MAQKGWIRTRWMKSLVALFLTVVVSLLAYGNMLRTVGDGTLYVSDVETRVRDYDSASNRTASGSLARLLTTSMAKMGHSRRALQASKTTRLRLIPKHRASLARDPFSSLLKEATDVTEGIDDSHFSTHSSENWLFHASSSALNEIMDSVGLRDSEAFDRRETGDRGVVTPKERMQLTSEKPIFIVLLGRMRTGSSLIGEIFNQNENIGFLYEPLHAVCEWSKNGAIPRSQFHSASAKLLQNISRCEFPSNFISSIVHWPTGGGWHSRLIQPVCAATNRCRYATPKMLYDRCSEFVKYRGVKTIRADFDTLLPIIKDDSVDVRILHLLRDPRGTANSRREVYAKEGNSLKWRLTARRPRYPPRRGSPTYPLRQNPYFPRSTSLHTRPYYQPRSRLEQTGILNSADVFPFLNTIPAYCNWLRSTVKVAQSKPEWLRGRYKLVRYEEFANEPIRATEDIYRFLRMDLPSSVREWLSKNTQSASKPKDKLYGLHRNSSEVVFKWRSEMTSHEATQVERECGDIMEKLGYKRTSGKLRLSDLSKSLLLPLPDDIPREL
ncbi:carbohydrate sulfotransferase 1-like [Diadema setosum]|uniref:carbohydrate sulfotransferase 1-like n=1 Tax=Diadema setosum TaxID=31175 RepID=UPI003B3B93B6